VKKALRNLLAACAGLVLALSATESLAEQSSIPEVVQLWPGQPPGTESWTGKEVHVTVRVPGSDDKSESILNVTTPTLTVFRPASGKGTGAAMVVCPGGAFAALAFGHEGVQVGQWLAARGVTAFVLKYRVRMPADFRLPTDVRRHPERFDELARKLEPGRQIAIADAVQAIRYIRANSATYGVAPDRIGIMGFSAGALTTTGVITDGPADARPNLAAPIYGAMVDKPPPADAPPIFIVAAQDDPLAPVAKSLEIFTRWTKAELPAELHIYETGGHGFGIAKLHKRSDDWPSAFEPWLAARGWARAPAKP
jgi:acetyl esterase/lipase